jgi:hypothetical protein
MGLTGPYGLEKDEVLKYLRAKHDIVALITLLGSCNNI